MERPVKIKLKFLLPILFAVLVLCIQSFVSSSGPLAQTKTTVAPGNVRLPPASPGPGGAGPWHMVATSDGAAYLYSEFDGDVWYVRQNTRTRVIAAK